MSEYTVRLASKSDVKKYSVFKLHKDDEISWTEAKMRRENENQPWQLKIGSNRTARRYKAIKEGGVGDNASYFIFYKPENKSDTYEVCPIEEWYSISATQRYKTLTAEEAEQKFEQRHKMLNLFSVMHLKKTGDAEEVESSHERKSFKISEMDDWGESGEEGSDDDGEETKSKVRRKKGEDNPEAPEEAKEDSDEGDHEQREVDYMSDSSTSSSISADAKGNSEVKGIAEEDALRDLLNSDEDEDVGNVEPNRNKSSDPNSLGTVHFKNQDDDESDDSSDSDDFDVDDEKIDSMFSKKTMPSQLPVVEQEPAATAAAATKRKPTAATTSQPIKKLCVPDTAPANSQERLIEDLVKKYLSRKPMTLKALLKDIKSKLRRIGSTPEMDSALLNTIASIIKRLNPDKQKISDITYFSLRS